MVKLFDALAASPAQEYAAGTPLIRQGAANGDVYLIASGFVDLFSTSVVDGLERSVTWRGPGQLVGDAGAVLGAAAPVAARTATRCVLHRLSAPAFVRLLDPRPTSALWHLVRARSEQVLEQTHTRALFASARARQRLEYVLWRLARQQHGRMLTGETRLTTYSPTNRELAGYVGVNSTYVPMLFASLEREGIARRHRGFIVIADPERLHHGRAAWPRARTDAALWCELLGLGTARRFDSGYSLFQQHDPAEDVYLIESGFVDVCASNGSPSTERSLWWHEAGELLGDTAAVLAATEQVTATTRTRSRLHCVPARVFLAALDQPRSPLLHDLLIAQSGDAHDATQDMAIAQLQPARHMLEHVLRRLATQHASDATGQVTLSDYSPSNATLAAFIGTEERYLSHLFHQLKDDGIAWRDSKRVITIGKEPAFSAARAAPSHYDHHPRWTELAAAQNA